MVQEENSLRSSRAYGESAGQYAEFSQLNQGYQLSEKIVKEILASELRMILETEPQARPILVADIGAGNGISTRRIRRGLQEEYSFDLSDFRIVTIEPDSGQILQNEELVKDGKADKIDVCAKAEDMPFSNDFFQMAMMNQAIHWIPKRNLSRALTEIKRIIRPGGPVILASSGFIQGLNDGHHYTTHPSYLLYLDEMEKELVKRGFWQDSYGKFSTENPIVNPFFHQISLYEIPALMQETGYVDVNMRIAFLKYVNAEEMTHRMISGASIFLFAGGWADKIDKTTREQIARAGFGRLKEKHPEMLDKLDKDPAYDPLILYYARKPR